MDPDRQGQWDRRFKTRDRGIQTGTGTVYSKIQRDRDRWMEGAWRGQQAWHGSLHAHATLLHSTEHAYLPSSGEENLSPLLKLSLFAVCFLDE